MLVFSVIFLCNQDAFVNIFDCSLYSFSALFVFKISVVKTYSISFVVSVAGMCTCTMSGDPHYRTFDGYMIHFMGQCKYTVAESMLPDDACKFHVKVKNTKRGRPTSRVTWTKYVYIEFAGEIIRYNSPRNMIQVGRSAPLHSIHVIKCSANWEPKIRSRFFFIFFCHFFEMYYLLNALNGLYVGDTCGIKLSWVYYVPALLMMIRIVK